MNNLLKRIKNGYNGLIRKIIIQAMPQNAEIIVSVMDFENNQNWINIKFLLTEIEAFKIFKAPKTSNTVLYQGISLLEVNDLFYVVFSPYCDEIENLEEVRKSDIYFGCKGIFCDILPYEE